jgi:hypothetical protein
MGLPKKLKGSLVFQKKRIKNSGSHLNVQALVLPVNNDENIIAKVLQVYAKVAGTFFKKLLLKTQPDIRDVAH